MGRQQPMTISTAHAALATGGSVIIVRIGGDLGVSSLIGPEHQYSGVAGDTALDQALAQRVSNPPERVVVDLTEVSYLGSLGLSALLRLKKRAEQAGSRVTFVGTDELMSLLKHSHLQSVVTLHPTVESAIAAQ